MIERIVRQVVPMAVRQAVNDRAYWGDQRALAVPLNREERALRHLGPWLAEGRATMPVARQYWREQFQPDPSKPMTHEDEAATLRFDRDMLDLYGDPERTLDAPLGMSDDLAEAYGAMQVAGLHWGPPPPIQKGEPE